MLELNPVQLHNQLADVRKAYRLVYQFQKRVLNILRLFEDEFSIEYYGGYAQFSNQTPAASFGSLDDSPWDWLNLYLHEFHFREEELRYRYRINLSVFLVSDTGYFDALNADKSNTKTFVPADESTSKLVFMIGKDAWHDSFDDFQLNFKSNSPDFIRTTKKGTVLAKSFELDTFSSQMSAIQAFRQLLSFWRENGIYELNMKHL